MAFRGIWKTDVRQGFVALGVSSLAGVVRTEIGGGHFIETAAPIEYVEDDGRPFEEGEEVEIVVRRVQKDQGES